mgnify:CR=1 FL=1
MTASTGPWRELARRLADELVADGVLVSSAWREAVVAIPRSSCESWMADAMRLLARRNAAFKRLASRLRLGSKGNGQVRFLSVVHQFAVLDAPVLPGFLGPGVQSRLALRRVLLEVGRRRYRDDDDLYKLAVGIEWERHFDARHRGGVVRFGVGASVGVWRGIGLDPVGA